MSAAGIEERIRRVADDAMDLSGQRQAARQIQDLISSAPPSASLIEELAAAYERLNGGDHALVAVRSSANAEDLKDASFAGAQETYLGLSGMEAVLSGVIACWASLFTPRAIAYRGRFGHQDHLAMGVVVQELVAAQAAGVLCTVDPVTGDRSQIAIEATPGLGVALVGGEVTPDRFLVDKVTLDIRDREVGVKTIAYRLDADGRVRARGLPAEERGAPCIRDLEAIALAEAGLRIERELGSPQDVEWALGPGPVGPRTLFLLQTRPETVWSRRPPRAFGGSADVTQRVAQTFSTTIPLDRWARGSAEAPDRET